MAFKDNSKAWFQTTFFPTQAQFWQVFDWLRWKDEPVSIAEVTGLADILNNSFAIVTKEKFTVDGTGNFSYTIPAGFVLNSISVLPAADGLAACTNVGGVSGDIVPSDMVLAATGAYWLLSKQVIAATTIIITAIPNTVLVFIKTKII